MNATPSRVSYRVELRPAAQQATITVELHHIPFRGALRVRTPTWVPGAYGFMRYGRVIHSLHAEDAATGKTVTCTRDGWSGWRLEDAPATVRLRYGVNPADPGFAELLGYIQHDQAVLLGPLFVEVPDHTGPVDVELVAPQGWAHHVPQGGQPVASTANHWRFENYRTLLDTPLCLGAMDVRTRRHKEIAYSFVFLNRGAAMTLEADRWMDDCMRVVAQTHAVFDGEAPFSAYSFLVSFHPDHHWGLEHRTSTMVGVGPDAFIDPLERIRSLRLVAHELFHAWNVCSLKPVEFMHPDLERGSFTDALWVAEGFTRYHEYLLCVRAGLMTPTEMLSNVVNYHRQQRWMPASARTAPTDSSLATFLNHHRYPGMFNTAIDYYDAGMLVAFDLDAFLVANASTHLSAFFGRFWKDNVSSGYTTADMVAALGKVHPGAAELAQREATTPQRSVEERLADLGFTVGFRSSPYAGFTLEGNAGPKVAQVLDNGPAADAGLAAGDVITAVDGLAFGLKALQYLVGRAQQVELIVQRGAAFHTLTVVPQPRRELASLRFTGDAQALARLKTWLGREDVAFQAGEDVPLSLYDNFHGIHALI